MTYNQNAVASGIVRVGAYDPGVGPGGSEVVAFESGLLYVTNGAVVVAFDVKPDGSLTNQREFGKLQGGTAGDGSAVDQQGRLYVATGPDSHLAIDLEAADGTALDASSLRIEPIAAANRPVRLRVIGGGDA